MKDLTPRELAALLEGPNPPRMLDVREAHELKISKIDGVLHIPMSEVPARLAEIAPDGEWVIVCRSGGRSGQIADFLKRKGYQAANLLTGMNGWVADVDPSQPRY